jgi:hypothetical protein
LDFNSRGSDNARHAAVHRDALPRDVLARGGGQQQRDAFEVLVVAQAQQRRGGLEILFAQGSQRAW